MSPPIPIPHDVRGWVRQAFADCNARVAKTISDTPTTHEVALDMTFIHPALCWIGRVPRTLTSGWTVRIATHYLGGGRHYGEWNGWERRWEVADIGVLVMFREAGKLRRTKVALLQSKRLYPDEQEFEEVVKLVESTSTTSPARCPVGGTQISALNSVLPAAVKGCGRFGSIRWRPSTRTESVSGSVSS
jgi:hypothetical protein